ncbi:hypothetical protein KY346_00605 [Candidatus Woesearchaeota archaeon]|nr:hypothetical protein [Candidatus Woesearchaeota archaeon]
MAKKCVFIEAMPNNGPAGDYQEQNKKILKVLKEKYAVITYHSLEHAAYQMTHADAEQCSDVSFMVTNIPYSVQIPEIAKIKAESIRKRLEGLVGEEKEAELKNISDENAFSSYKEAFECLKTLKQAFPKMKIIAYSAAHETVRKKVYEDNLAFRVHQRNHRSGPAWERANLINGIERALEGWQGCE